MVASIDQEPLDFEPLYESEHFAAGWPIFDDEDRDFRTDAVFLSGPGVPPGVCIGSMPYGPTAIAIDPQERWSVMVGAGVIVYRLSEPWSPYRFIAENWPTKPFHDRNWGLAHVRGTEQWWEYGRDRLDLLQLDSVVHVAGERFEAGWSRGAEGPTRWAILAESRVVRPLNWLPDNP